MAGFQLPFGVKPVNAVPVDYYSGPYTNITIQDAIDLANSSIPQAIRFKTMEVRLIVNGIGAKYWYRDGVTNDDLVEFTTSSSFYVQGGTTYSSDTTSNIYRTGSVNIGSNATYSSTAKLYVSSNQPGAFRLEDTTQGPGKLLTSDANGVASWTSLSSVGISGSASFIPKFTGTSSLGNSRFKDNGTIGSYEISAGNGVYFLSGANTYLTLDRGQSAMSFSLGNGQVSQTSKIISNNTFGLDIESTGYISFKTGLTSSFVVDNNGTYNNSRGLNNTSFGYQSLYSDTTLISSYSILNAGSGYTASSTYSNVQLSYISGSRALTYPIATIYVGSTGSVSIVTLVTSGKGYIDNTTVMGANLAPSGVTFSVKIDSLVGNYNTGIGNQSLYSNTIGSYNTAVGFEAGNLISGTTSGATQSNNSVFIGYDTRPSLGNNINEIVIGATAIGNGSNSVTLGNDNITKTILKGNVGIGLTGPSTKLHIYATQSGAFRLVDGTQGLGKVLVSDATGVGTWTASVTGPQGVTGATGIGYVLSTIEPKTLFATSQSFFSPSLPSTSSAFIVGNRVRVIADVDVNIWMEGNITLFSGLSLVVDVDTISGTAGNTYTGWKFTLVGNKGATGATGFGVTSSFYIQGTMNYAYDTTSSIYRTGAILIGTASVDTNDRFVVSSTTGTVSLVVDNNGSVYNLSKGITNSVFGYQSLQNNTTGTDNSSFGFQSLQNNTTGSQNTSLGRGTLRYNTTGSQNTAFGYQALNGNGTGISTFTLSNPGSGFTQSTIYSNVQLSYISGSSASFYPRVNVVVGAGGTVSSVTLVTTGTGFIDNTTVMGTNLGGSGTTFSISVLTISTGINNTAIGSLALLNNTIGYSNVAVGRIALYNNTTGYLNTSVGQQSLYQNTTGIYNNAFGYGSLQNNINGSFNTSIGLQALLYNTTGSYSTALGHLTLRDSTTVVSALGTFSVGSGYITGTYSDILLTYSSGSTALTYPTATIVVGAGGTVSSVTLSTTLRGVGFKDTTTIMSVATASVGGTGSGFTVRVSTLEAASGNTALGHQALMYNRTGSSNISIGFNSLHTNSTGSQNVAIGGNALFFNTTGGANTAIGFNSSYNNTTGTNTAIGWKSLYWNTTGTNNTALGYQALLYNITGSDNVGVGHQSLFNATASSSNNTAIGYQSLFSILENSNNNTAIGYHAGHYITSDVVSATLSNWSTYIGSYTRGYAYDTTHEVVIGASAIGNGSYSVTIGNDSITKTILKGNVGIGLTGPSTKLHIYATQSGAFRLEDGTQGPGKILTCDATGVGSWATASGAPIVEPSQITITTTSSITTGTTASNGYGQSGKNVIIDNGPNAINITVNGGTDFVASYVKHGTASITFVQGSGRTLIQVDSTLVLNGAVGSTATISSILTTDYLRISNA